MAKERYILHVDMDAFFASVEQRDHPEYIGKPVIVGSDPKGGKGRGVVAACSYEAREFGIHSAMPISKAYKLCPHAVFLRGNMSRYAQVSNEMLDILERFTPDIEPISIDEAFLDISGSYKHFGTPIETCRKIKRTIKKETALTASIGMAPNMMTAKIASDLKKPDGLVIVPEKDLLKFLHPLPIKKLWGVGVKSQEALATIGVRTIGDIADFDKKKFVDIFGMNGLHLWELANGIDPREVESEAGDAKSISNEYTFSEDTKSGMSIKNALMSLSGKVSHRMRKAGVKCRTVTLKIRFDDFKTYTRAVTLDAPTNFVTDLYGTCMDRAGTFDLKKKAVRLVGVKASNLVDAAWETDLFAGASIKANKTEKVHKAVDLIKDRYGDRAIGFRSA